MAYWLRKDIRPVELARDAFLGAGRKPYDRVARGGTDGSRLTELGLPIPNLFCGEQNPHGPLEWVAVQADFSYKAGAAIPDASGKA